MPEQSRATNSGTIAISNDHNSSYSMVYNSSDSDSDSDYIATRKRTRKSGKNLNKIAAASPSRKRDNSNSPKAQILGNVSRFLLSNSWAQILNFFSVK